jgi:hypothetical protein
VPRFVLPDARFLLPDDEPPDPLAPSAAATAPCCGTAVTCWPAWPASWPVSWPSCPAAPPAALPLPPAAWPATWSTPWPTPPSACPAPAAACGTAPPGPSAPAPHRSVLRAPRSPRPPGRPPAAPSVLRRRGSGSRRRRGRVPCRQCRRCFRPYRPPSSPGSRGSRGSGRASTGRGQGCRTDSRAVPSAAPRLQRLQCRSRPCQD